MAQKVWVNTGSNDGLFSTKSESRTYLCDNLKNVLMSLTCKKREYKATTKVMLEWNSYIRRAHKGVLCSL